LRIAVVGVGNILSGDEGIGVHIARKLKSYKLPPEVEVYDCGTSGIAVLEALDGADKAVIIDAALTGSKPGTVVKLTLHDAEKMESSIFTMASLHNLDLITTLQLAKLTEAYKLPKDIVILAIEPQSLEYSMKLSPILKRRMPELVDAVLKEVYRLLSE